MAPVTLVTVRVIWDSHAIPLRLAFHALHVRPEPGWPFGRKGLAIAGAWRQLATPAAAGMLLLDGDVAADPQDVAGMLHAVESDPAAVWTAPVRLWPVSTHRPDWHWGHWATADGPGQHLVTDSPDMFSFCFTYLPRALIERCIREGLGGWAYPGTDGRVAQAARRAGVRVRVATDCRPVHLNF